MQQLGAVQIVEVFSGVLDLVGRARALVDEAAHRFRVHGAQARPSPDLIVLVQAGVGNGDEMLAAKILAVQRRDQRLAATRHAARF